MLTEEDKEQCHKEYAATYHLMMPVRECIDFTLKWAEKTILEKSAEGFEEWMKSEIWTHLQFKSCEEQRKEAFTAGAMSNAKKLKQCEECRDELNACLRHYGGTAHKAFQEKIKDLEEELAEAREALRFYGDGASWFYPGNDFPNFLIAKSDIDKGSRKTKSGKSEKLNCGGKRAREFFAKYPEGR